MIFKQHNICFDRFVMMSRSTKNMFMLLALVIYIISALKSASSVGEPGAIIKCKDGERQALVKIKEDFRKIDQDCVFSSWGNEEDKRECCKWIGIRCDNKSGHVIRLDLSPSTLGRNYYLEGNLSSSLVDLQHLHYLDLSSIVLLENPILSFIGRLRKLRHLDLSDTNMIGNVPLELGNLSSLQFLNLSGNWDLEMKTLEWASRLSSLQSLDLSYINMSLAHDWVFVVSNLPQLRFLELSDCGLRDTVPPSLSFVNSSKVLSIINLSYNDLSFSVLQWLFNYSHSLVHLGLSGNNMIGNVPLELGNLSSLQFLDLSENSELEIKTLEWASRLSSLQLLDLSYTNMSFAHDWVFVVSNLPQLRFLELSDCGLRDTVPPSLSFVNSSKLLSIINLSSNNLSFSVFQWLFNYSHSLVHLDLSLCSLKSSIPRAFENMPALKYLYLSGNQLEGSIPKSFGNMTALAYLDLSGNDIDGSIPQSLGNMTTLEYLDLTNNKLEGEIPKSIWGGCYLKMLLANNNNLSGELHFAESSTRCAHFPLENLDLSNNRIKGLLPNFTMYPSLIELSLDSNELDGNLSKRVGELSKLEILDISANFLKGVISEAHFSKLVKLQFLDLSSNKNLVFEINPDWNPPFQLKSINLRSCKLGPHFPKWLRTQKSVLELDISNSGILGAIPRWFWIDLSVDSLNLSNNGISKLTLDNELIDIQQWAFEIDLSSNQVEGPIPLFLLQAYSLYLFNNSFSGLNSLCNVTRFVPLTFLDVSNNQLSGEIPDCWSHANYLMMLNLASNKLRGEIPKSIGFMTYIETLRLSNNHLIGKLPSSLKNCTWLKILDVEENRLSGPIPTWIGKSLTDIVVLSLRSNTFSGSIPLQLCHLQALQILDLSSNNLSSSIPACLCNITSMKEVGTYPVVVNYTVNNGSSQSEKNERLHLMWKGSLNDLRNLGLLRSIDLSSNKLTGEIPKEITQLVGLVSLNLSRNNISGEIPTGIGQLKSLDVLDLSKNLLSGRIPSSLSQVSGLSTLDLSNNSLSGKIPTGTQLQTRDATAYLGNPDLCGEPLSKKCPGEEEPTTSGATKDHVDAQEDEDRFVTKGFYISTAIGFIAGFWGICFALIFNKSWRYRYFKSLNNAGDWLYVTVALSKAKLLRIVKG